MARLGRRKRTHIEAESTDSPTNGGDCEGNEIVVAPDDFTDDLIDIVWSHLPMLSAARFSVVSPKYRHSWKHCKNVIFDKSMVQGKDKTHVVRLVNTTLKKYQGHKIDKFSIYVNPNRIVSYLIKWIKLVVALNVEEIELDYSPSYAPWSLFFTLHGARTLKSLKLVNVQVEGSRGKVEWSGLINLRELSLRGCDLRFFDAMLDQITWLEYLEIVKCVYMPPRSMYGQRHERLRTLKIGACRDLMWTEVNAPNLKTFYYQGNRRMIILKSSLERMFFSYNNILMERYETRNLEKILMNPLAKSLKVLTVNSVFIEVLCPVIQQGDLGATQSTFPNLTELHIFMENYTYETVGYVRYLLKHCPRLETLHIDLGRCKADGGVRGLAERKKAHSTDPEHFHHLKVMKIKGFRSSLQEHDLLEYIATRSSALRTVALVGHRSYMRPNLPSIFLNNHLPNVALSPDVKISVYDYDDDRSCISPSHTKSWYLT